jgi:hypothetical protein
MFYEIPAARAAGTSAMRLRIALGFLDVYAANFL